MHIKRILFYIQKQSPRGVLYKKGTLAQVFSCEFCEISRNNFSYRTPPVAASVYLRKRNIVSLIYCNKLILKVTKITKIKNNRWRRSIKKVVLNNFKKFTGSTCQSILNKVARVNPATLLKRDFGTCVFLRILRTSFQLAFTCSKLTIWTEQRQHRSGGSTINFEQISHLALKFPLLTLSR